ncbi:hypothetical protein BKA83DRAFT_4130285 [Pisolithus microcarpus]|nr:hypothetical protein BKA83DRAFT_4130285 [Pisolithus microcarpus]
MFVTVKLGALERRGLGFRRSSTNGLGMAAIPSLRNDMRSHCRRKNTFAEVAATPTCLGPVPAFNLQYLVLNNLTPIFWRSRVSEAVVVAAAIWFMWDRRDAIKDAMTDDRMIDEETTDAELLNRKTFKGTFGHGSGNTVDNPTTTSRVTNPITCGCAGIVQIILVPQNTSSWPQSAATSHSGFQITFYDGAFMSATGEGQDEREESYFAEIDTKLAKQPAPFVGFTQLFRYIAPFELFLDAIGILDAMAAGVAQSADSSGNATAISSARRDFDSSGPGITYKNIRAIRLPGGSIIPPRSTGRLLSIDGGDFVAVCREHENSGWKVVIDALTEWTADLYQDVTFGRTGPGSMPLTLRLEDVAMEIDDGGDEALATDALDLIRSVIQDQPGLAEELLEALEIGDASSTTDSHPPDLVQLTTMILEEAPQRLASTELFAHAIRHICYECPLGTSHPSQAPGFAFVALAAERVSGQHTMTLALLHLVQKLTQEAFASVVMIPADSERLNRVKEEVLLRAVNFVHGEIWVEHLGWKYVHLGDLFEIGRRISSLFSYILVQSPAIGNRPYPVLSQAIIETVMHTASSSSILPLVSAVASSPKTLGGLYASRHLGDARRLIFLFKSHLQLIRLVPNFKQQTSPQGTKKTFSSRSGRISGGAGFSDSARARVDPVHVLATFVKEWNVGIAVPLEAVKVLHALSSSLSMMAFSPPTIVGHLTNPEAAVVSLVRIVHHPYDDLPLRIAVWNFITLAVDKEPALANLFVAGDFHIPIGEGKVNVSKQTRRDAKGRKEQMTTLEVARTTLERRKDLWEANPPLLASILQFLYVVWQRGHEHKAPIEVTRQDEEFWSRVAAIPREELGPYPD